MIKINCAQKSFELDRLAQIAYDELELSGNIIVEIDFVLASDIKEINYKFRHKNVETDVLSFPLIDCVLPFTRQNYPLDYDEANNCVNIGNILICQEVAKAQADEYGHSYEREVGYLFIHALLHLLGYDHENENDKKIMRQKEEKILLKADLSR